MQQTRQELKAVFARWETLQRAELEPVQSLFELHKCKFVMVMVSHSAKHFCMCIIWWINEIKAQKNVKLNRMLCLKTGAVIMEFKSNYNGILLFVFHNWIELICCRCVLLFPAAQCHDQIVTFHIGTVATNIKPSQSTSEISSRSRTLSILSSKY